MTEFNSPNEEICHNMLTSLWICIYFKNIDLANFLVRNIDFLKKFASFPGKTNLDDRFEDLIDFGRRINNIVFETFLRSKETFLALLIAQYDIFLCEDSLYHIIKNDMIEVLKYS